MTCQQTAEFQSGDLFIRPVKLPKVGDRIGGHRHVFAHTMIVLHGTVRVTLTDAEGVATVCDLEPEDYLLVPAEMVHDAEATADDTRFWCVFPRGTR